ncbi:hypothetical protein [Burkholderia thailandensis]|uniref:hypothetical protein n=1 Tax=Burkholderia thailandensis TaxID=57975 RepID=UPI000B2B279B|nr:hypothetical protein [Burkholderia thailandensis]
MATPRRVTRDRHRKPRSCSPPASLDAPAGANTFFADVFRVVESASRSAMKACGLRRAVGARRDWPVFPQSPCPFRPLRDRVDAHPSDESEAGIDEAVRTPTLASPKFAQLCESAYVPFDVRLHAAEPKFTRQMTIGRHFG